MKKIRRMRIAVETERLVVMSRSRNLFSLCATCGYEVRLLTAGEAALLARIELPRFIGV